MAYKVEVTDTFGGEANYCWVHRHSITPKSDKRAAIVRAAKAAEGWTGLRCTTHDFGDMIEVRPAGLLQVMFIDWDDSEGQS